MLKEKLGRRIKEIRKARGYSQEQLAELINMDIPNLSNIERGKRFMTAETLEKIAKALDVTEKELFDFSAQEPERYVKPDLQNLLINLKEKDLQFILEVTKSYIKTKQM